MIEIFISTRSISDFFLTKKSSLSSVWLQPDMNHLDHLLTSLIRWTIESDTTCWDQNLQGVMQKLIVANHCDSKSNDKKKYT